MGLLGGSRIDGITIFLTVTLVLYTILCNGVFATFTGSSFVDPYGGKVYDIDLGEEYQHNDIKNVTGDIIPSMIVFDNLDPDRAIKWYRPFFIDETFTVHSYGKNWWDSWVTFTLNPKSISTDALLQIYNSDMNFSKVVYNHGGEFETHVFYCPLFYYNETEGVTYLDEDLETSFDNGEITVVMATNQTFRSSYDVGKIFGILTGFSTYDIPYEASVVIGGLFWVLLMLLIVKLVVG